MACLIPAKTANMTFDDLLKLIHKTCHKRGAKTSS